MLGFLKRKRHKKPTPPWVAWLMVGFVFYAIVANNSSAPRPDAPATAPVDTARIADSLKIDSYKDRLLPRAVQKLQVQDTLTGSGAPASCGQRVAIAYKTFLADGTPVADTATREQPLRFTIGEAAAMPAFEQGVLGMAKGGTRYIFAPANTAYGLPAFARDDVPDAALVRFEVEMLEAAPALPDSSAYRVFGDKEDSAVPLRCGQPVSVRVTLTSIEGKQLYQTPAPITFTPGKSQVFSGLEQGVLGMPAGGFRTLVVPPAFQRTLNGNPPSIDFPLPKKQTVLVDIESVP